MTRLVPIFLLCSTSIVLFAQVDEITGERIRAHVKFLSSDLLEGRGVGVRGGEVATAYIASQFAIAGLKRAGDGGTFFQKVPLVGSEPESGVTLTAAIKDQTVSFRWLEDLSGGSFLQKPNADFEGDAIFVGHGITAPEFNWDDYKDVDVKGKVVVLFTNEPPSENPRFFGGKALTYYGRWTYKYEQATRKGAIACLIIHTSPTAGYGWPVVQGFSREDSQVKLAPGEAALNFAGWIQEKAAEQIAQSIGKTVPELLAMANKPGFRAIPLPIHFKGRVPMKIREFDSVNVAGMVPGSDPQGRTEAVVFSAHWDHLGIGQPVDGDKIYNGAVDNATGCAMIMEMARAWAGLERKPRRSAIFIAVTAEESGLRGSEYYGAHPLIAAGKTILNLNFDSFYPFGRMKDVNVNGAERTTVWPTVQEVARRFELKIEGDAHPEQGEYYRSDHFSFARVGIPAFSINGGTHFYGKPDDFETKAFEEYNDKHYHQPSDEYKEDWDMAGMEQMARFGFTLGQTVANQSGVSSWVKGDEFLPARVKSLSR
jgi:Zn-dependent M28 family amino/carboxypeptidase